MADKPLLLFPTPGSADRTRPTGHFIPKKLHYPSRGEQGNRLSPIFE